MRNKYDKEYLRYHVNVTMSLKERETIEREAAILGMTMANYMRSVFFGRIKRINDVN